MEIAIKAAKQPAIQARARKDERPNTEVAIWRPVALEVNGEDAIGLIKSHVLYFPLGEEWYKVNLTKAGISLPDLDKSSLYSFSLIINEVPREVLTEEEKAARKKARRQARRAARRVAELEEELED